MLMLRIEIVCLLLTLNWPEKKLIKKTSPGYDDTCLEPRTWEMEAGGSAQGQP